MGELTHKLKPGDEAFITGIFMPERHVWHDGVKTGFFVHTYLDVLNIRKEKISYQDELYRISESRRKDMMSSITKSEAQGQNISEHLSKVIAPEIYGHEYIKRALLLVTVGGVDRNYGDGMEIRG